MINHKRGTNQTKSNLSTPEMTPSKRVILWTAPRCVSTAFERCIMNLKNSKIIHEPFSLPFYFGPERQSQRYSCQAGDHKETYESVTRMLQKDYYGKEIIFSKDMAYYIDKKFHIFLEEGFNNFKHSFLIRDPKKAVLSLYEASTNSKLTGWNYFDPVEAGFKQLFQFYQFVKRHLDASPVVVDADDLLDNPEGIMMSYCEAVEVEYQENMTRWNPGPVEEWDIWAGWHEDVLKSSGFTSRKNRRSKTREEEEYIPQEVVDTIENSMLCFDTMYTARIHAKKLTWVQIKSLPLQ